MRILVVEDETELARHITSALTRHGHLASARHTGPEGLRAALAELPDLIVLDLNLPGLGGLDLMGALKRAGCASRVLVLTARGELEDRIRGLRAGADDYLPKPFSLGELIARVEALGRRGAPSGPDDVLKVDNLAMDVQHRRVVRGGQDIALSPREFDVLQVLLQEPGRYFSRVELCERVWRRQHEYDTRTVEIFIARLRRKVDAAGFTPLILTQRGIGYAICPPPCSP